jgi:hypothetical protein
VLDVLKPLQHKRIIERELEGFGIRLNKTPPNIIFKKKEKGGLNLQTMVKTKKQQRFPFCQMVKTKNNKDFPFVNLRLVLESALMTQQNDPHPQHHLQEEREGQN